MGPNVTPKSVSGPDPIVDTEPEITEEDVCSWSSSSLSSSVIVATESESLPALI